MRREGKLVVICHPKKFCRCSKSSCSRSSCSSSCSRVVVKLSVDTVVVAVAEIVEVVVLVVEM